MSIAALATKQDPKQRIPIVSLQFRVKAALAAVSSAGGRRRPLHLIQGGREPRLQIRSLSANGQRRKLFPAGGVATGGQVSITTGNPGKAAAPSSKVLRRPTESSIPMTFLQGPQAVSRFARKAQNPAKMRPLVATNPSLGCPRKSQSAAPGGQPFPSVNDTFRTKVIPRKSAIFLVTISEDASLSATNVFTRSDRDA